MNPTATTGKRYKGPFSSPWRMSMKGLWGCCAPPMTGTPCGPRIRLSILAACLSSAWRCCLFIIASYQHVNIRRADRVVFPRQALNDRGGMFAKEYPVAFTHLAVVGVDGDDFALDLGDGVGELHDEFPRYRVGSAIR